MKYQRSARVLFVFVIVLLLLAACGAPAATEGVVTPTNTPEPKKCDLVNEGTGEWDCSNLEISPQVNANREIKLYNVPAKLTPYAFSLDDSGLQAQPFADFKGIISIVCDIRFFDGDNNMVTDIAKYQESPDLPMKLSITYNQYDVTALAQFNDANKTDYSQADFAPIIYTQDKASPSKGAWIKFPPNVVLDGVDGNDNPIAGFTIIIKSWGDPPVGVGIPK